MTVIDLDAVRQAKLDAEGEAAHEAGEAWKLEKLDDPSEAVGVIEHDTHPIVVLSFETLQDFALSRDGARSLIGALTLALTMDSAGESPS